MFVKQNVLAFFAAIAVFLLLVPGFCFSGENDSPSSSPAAMNLLGSKKSGHNLPPGWEIRYDEDFEEDKPQGWELRRDEQVTVEAGWGKLTIANKQKTEKLLLFRELEIDPLGDYRIEIKLNFDGGSSGRNFGLFWGSKDKEYYNELGLTPKREARLQAVWEGKLQKDAVPAAFQNLTEYAALKSGSSSNVLVIQKSGKRLDFFANGEKLFFTEEMPLLGNRIGFSLDPQTGINVDRIVVAQDSTALRELTALSYSRLVKKNSPTLAQFSPDGRRLVTLSTHHNNGFYGGSMMMFWDTTKEDPELIGSYLYWGLLDMSSAFSFSGSGEDFAFISPDKKLVVARLVEGKVSVQRVVKGLLYPRCIALSPDASLLAVSEFSKLHLFDTATYQEIASVDRQVIESYSNMRFSHDGKRLVAGGKTTVWLYGTPGLNKLADYPLENLYFHPRPTRTIGISAGRIVTADWLGKTLASSDAAVSGLEYLAMNPDGDIVSWSRYKYGYFVADGDKALLVEEKRKFDLLAVAYDSKRRMWQIATPGRFARVPRPDDRIIKASRLYAEASELLRNGFVRPGGIKMLAALDTYPPVQLQSVKDDLLKRETPFISLAGQVSLKQYTRSMNGEWIATLGLWFGGGGGRGPQVGMVLAGSSADKRGLKKGDIILSANGAPISEKTALWQTIKGLAVGTLVRLEVLRGAEEIPFTLEVESEPEFRNTAFNGIFWYGVTAAKAGKSELTAWAAKEIRHLAEKYPAAYRREELAFSATGLEALAMAAQGRATEAYDHIISQGGLVADDYHWLKSIIMTYPDMWAPLYSDKKKLAYILQVKEAELKTPTGQWPMLVSFPDKDGTMLEVAGGSAPAVPAATTSSPKKAAGVILLE